MGSMHTRTDGGDGHHKYAHDCRLRGMHKPRKIEQTHGQRRRERLEHLYEADSQIEVGRVAPAVNTSKPVRGACGHTHPSATAVRQPTGAMLVR